MFKNRYDYMLALVSVIKPIKIIEVGISRGIRASQLIRLAKNFNSKIEYIGFDVFNTKDSKFHQMVGNGKKVASKKEIYDFLIQYCEDVTLFEGTTEETLWGKKIQGDLAFIDGDHRIEAIKKDFDSLKYSTLVVLDDFYMNKSYKNFDTDFYGCNQLISNLKDSEYCISPPSEILPEIRLAFFSYNKNLIGFIKNAFNKIYRK